MARSLRLKAWPLLAALLALGALLAWALPPEWLDWQGERGWPWRAFTSAFVHWTPRHLLGNLAACAVLGWFGVVARLPACCTLVWLLAWPLTQIGLLLRPELTAYGGLSGVLHAGVAIAAIELLTRTGRERLIGASIALVLALKIANEHPLGPVLQHEAAWDMPVVPLAHLSGAVAGTALALISLALARLRTRQQMQASRSSHTS